MADAHGPSSGEFRVRLSVGTKLLVSLVVLILLVITFLNVSTVLLVREDKRAYVYDAQATAAMLSGREFVGRVRSSLDTLRIALAAVDPRTPITAAQESALKSLIENQSDLLRLGLLRFDLGSLKTVSIFHTARESELKKLSLDPAPPELSSGWLEVVKTGLAEKSYAFLNLSQPGGAALVGILLADLKYLNDPAGVPVALGVLPLNGFGEDLRRVGLTLVDRNGWVLFDTDASRQFSRANIQDDPLFQRARSTQLKAGAAEFEYKGLHYLGSFVHPGFELTVLTRTEWRDAMAATYVLIEKFILLGGMAIGAAILFAILFSRSLTAPLKRLYEATQEVAKGNFKLALTATGRDELAALSTSFNFMSERISALMVEQAHKIELENQLAIASTVQKTLIPPPVFDHPCIRIRSHYRSAEHCGGDWWGFFTVGDKICLMIADATGHGVPSALITAAARGSLSVVHKLAVDHPSFVVSPNNVLRMVNRAIHESSGQAIMMTFFIGVVDLTKATLTYASAGHNPPWLYRKSSSRGGGSYESLSLMADGERLGEKADCPPLEEKTLALQSGDLLLLYTDGLLEGMNPAGKMYGKKQARRVITEALEKKQGSTPPDRVVSSLMDDFLGHMNGKNLDDDVTLAVAEFFPVDGVSPNAPG